MKTFSRTDEAGIFKLGMHMNNELLYCGIKTLIHCYFSSLYLSIFSGFSGICVKFFLETFQARRVFFVILVLVCKLKYYGLGLDPG